MATPVFVYGTLVDPHRTAAVLDEYEYGPDAVLKGLDRVQGTYPTLGPGEAVAGTVLRTPELGRLDRYEGVGEGLYVRVSIPWRDRDGTVETYVGSPEHLGIRDGWPGDGPLEARVERYVADNDVAVRVTSDPSP